MEKIPKKLGQAEPRAGVAGVAIGRCTHSIVFLNPDDKTEELFVSNSQTGVEELNRALQERGIKSLVMVGNHHWAIPFAYGLKALGVEVFYRSLLLKEGKRGRVGSVASMLPMVLRQKLPLRPFFQEKVAYKKEEPEKLPSFRLSRDYGRKIRELQSLVLQLYNLLAILFPEIVPAKKTSVRKGEETINLPVPEPQPPGLFTKKMRPVLENPNPRLLERTESTPATVRELAASSLAKYVPPSIYRETMERYQRLLARYDQAVEEKAFALNGLKEQVGGHPLVGLFKGCDTICVVVGFLGWRPWPNWRELRSFCGLDVTRLDSKGRPRISRKRPEIRRALHLLATRTTIGKELTRDLRGKRHKKVKGIERILKYLWSHGLKETATGELM